MKFLADENIAVSVVRNLREAGFDVKDVKEAGLCGSSANKLVELAKREGRVILTHDRDFSQIVFYKKVGVILIRCKKQDPLTVSKVLLKVLGSTLVKQIVGRLCVISEDNVSVQK